MTEARMPVPAAASPARPSSTPAPQRHGLRILQWVLQAQLAPGAALLAQPLADALGLSRFPVQQALAWLEQQGWVARPTRRGFVLVATPEAIQHVLQQATQAQGPSAYLRIACERLAGRLPKEMTESELARWCGLTRAQLAPVLRRMAQEGWVQRKSGNGWVFTDIIDTAQSHQDAYVFRMAIEPAALLAPHFRADPVVLQALQAEQTALRDGRLGQLTSEDLFEIGSRFHETLVGFSGNGFFVDALKRVNMRRRLVEYQAMARPVDFAEQCQEHLQLIALIQRGEQREAATLLHRHLDIVRAIKGQVLRDSQPDTAPLFLHF